jgi:GNAT superfamily N-acetyltransferase
VALEDGAGGQGEPVAVASAHFHTVRKNVWTPYVNWVVAWTRPDRRLRGYGRALSDFIRAEALRRGCVRLRSVAASRDGAAFHLALGDLLWARTPTSVILVDSPLDARAFPLGPPISVRAWSTAPLSREEVLRAGPLRYDTGNSV